MGVVGTIAPPGGVVGPGLGGVLLASFGWSSIFFVNLPICGLAARPPVLGCTTSCPSTLEGFRTWGQSSQGVVLLLVPLGMMGMNGGYLTDRYDPKPLMLAGSVLIVLGVLSLSLVLSSRTSELNLAWRLLLVGSGIGLFSSPNSTMLIGFGGRESMASASALLNFGARLGSVVGPLVLGLT